MTEAERRAAFEAAVVEALDALDMALLPLLINSPSTRALNREAIANVRAIYDIEPDAPAAAEAAQAEGGAA